jgi:hypothetical protein
MSRMRTGILGAIAASAALGAVQFAFGHDLTQELGSHISSGLRAFSATPDAANVTLDQVNRAAKADRAGLLAPALVRTKTISIRVDRVADTSVVVRIPLSAAEAARRAAPAPAALISTRPSAQRTVACEPVVSVLTEIAKRLQPGRCVT